MQITLDCEKLFNSISSLVSGKIPEKNETQELTTSELKKKGNTGNDRYSGHGYSGIDRYSGTKTPDDAILFTVSGITAIVEQKFRKFHFCSSKL